MTPRIYWLRSPLAMSSIAADGFKISHLKALIALGGALTGGHIRRHYGEYP